MAALFFVLNPSLVHGPQGKQVMWWLLMDKESPIDENAWITGKLDSGGEALPAE